MSFPKILMPYLVQNGLSIHSDRIFGGIERFKKLVYDNIPNVIPVEITKQERKNRTGSGIFRFELLQNDPDIIFINDMSKILGSDLIDYGRPTVWLCHEPLERTIMMVEMVKRFNEFTNKGGHLYFVSQNQHEFYDANCKRITGSYIKGVKGYINSACVIGNEQVYMKDREFDAVTVGRTLSSKDPFWIHKKLEHTNLSSAVITGDTISSKKQKEKKYFEKNQKWQKPQYTFRGLPHKETLLTMSKGGVYVSTCTFESWGITALEALSCGLPLILVTDVSGKHSSMSIPASSNHYKNIPKTIESKELKYIITEMNEISLTDRQNIAKMTQEKHSLSKFKDTMNKVFKDAL